MKQNFNKKVWIQAAIDVEDIDLAKKIAFMALDAGAEWLEVGTPLLYTYIWAYGHRIASKGRRIQCHPGGGLQMSLRRFVCASGRQTGRRLCDADSRLHG